MGEAVDAGRAEEEGIVRRIIRRVGERKRFELAFETDFGGVLCE